jgi:endonuclease/exonuclease/phosphatase family metal-dependent hydrolase
MNSLKVILFTVTAIGVLAADSAQGLIVGTFNIRYANEKDQARGNGWATRAPVIASLIRFHRFDVLGTQEGSTDQLNRLQELLPTHAYVGGGRDDGKNAGEHVAIFYRKDIFALKDQGTFWLSKTPDRPSIGWDAKFQRICTWVCLEEQATHKTYYFFNTHFDHKGSVAREESARLIINSIREISKGQPSILTGDFNVDQTSNCYKVLRDSLLLQDAHETAAERYELNGTPNGFNANAFSASRIDHIFHSPNLKPARYGVLTDSYRTVPNAATPETGSAAFPKEVKFREYEAKLRKRSMRHPLI